MTDHPSQGAPRGAGSDDVATAKSPGLLRRAWLPLLCGVLLGTIAFGIGRAGDPSYETCGYLRINSGPVDQVVLDLPGAEKPLVNVILETAGEVEQRRVATRAVRYLNGTPVDNADDLLESIAAKPDPNTGLIGVCAKGPTGRQAQRVSNATARAYVDLNREDQVKNLRAARRELDRLQRIRTAQLRRRGAQDEQLADSIEKGRLQLQQLTLAERINSNSVALSKPADLTNTPAGIPASALGFLGFIIGTALGIAFLVVRSLSDNRVRSLGELEQVAGAPVLASVRRARTLKRRQPLHELRGRHAEPFRLLLARLCNATEAEDRRAIVIAPVEDDGTSGSVAWYLGATAAAAGGRVLLVEADADRPSAVDDGGERPPGVRDVLAGTKTLEDIAFHVVADEAHAVDIAPPGGRTGGLRLNADAVRSFVTQARGMYDHMFIDTPPLGDADAVPFARQAEAAILVYRYGGPTADALRQACAQLAATGTPLLGVVAVGFMR